MCRMNDEVRKNVGSVATIVARRQPCLSHDGHAGSRLSLRVVQRVYSLMALALMQSMVRHDDSRTGSCPRIMLLSQPLATQPLTQHQHLIQDIIEYDHNRLMC